MGIITALAIYFVIWWTVLFVVLPFGVRSQVEDGDVVPGSADGAPTRPHLRLRLLATTALATFVFAVYYVATQVFAIGPDSFPHIIPGT
ncbi:DUF1467 family protein [Aureimonas mangrovi]|uniref:DUF1467 family protein n=1 Tax=Aureimonas mangrovi TaxID=2758041 RepID=UPI00163D7D80|nr:DUF1467 family protein [Aureimonas mangrovi]